MKILSILTASSLSLSLFIHAETPKQQIKAAQTQAQADQKDLLIIITASTWSQVSKTFDEAVLQSEAFQSETAKNYHTVILDYPAKREDAHTDLLEIRQDYRFRQMPSLIFADAEARPFAYTGASSNDPTEFLKTLADLRKNREAYLATMDEAFKAEGLKRAELIVQALKSLPLEVQEVIRDFYEPELQALAEADPEGKTGFLAEVKKAYALRQESEKFESLLQAGDFDQAIKDAQAAAKDLEGEDAQRLSLYLIRALAGKNQFAEAIEEVQKMSALAPDSEFGQNAAQYQSYLESLQKNHEARIALQEKRASIPKQPVVSKPVAIVQDIEQLRNDSQQADDDLAQTITRETELKKARQERIHSITELEKQLKKLRKEEEQFAEEMKALAQAKEGLARRAQALKDVIANHEAMEKRKRDVSELEKRAADLQKQAEELRQKAEEIKKGQ